MGPHGIPWRANGVEKKTAPQSGKTLCCSMHTRSTLCAMSKEWHRRQELSEHEKTKTHNFYDIFRNGLARDALFE